MTTGTSTILLALAGKRATFSVRQATYSPSRPFFLLLLLLLLARDEWDVGVFRGGEAGVMYVRQGAAAAKVRVSSGAGC